jgi:N utilization substance protein A
MTQGELEQQIDRAVQGFCKLEGVDEDLANRLVGEGYLSYDDLSVIEPPDLMVMGDLTESQVDAIVEQADVLAVEAEAREAQEKRAKKAAVAAAAVEAKRVAAEQQLQAQAASASEEAVSASEEAVSASEEAASASEEATVDSADSAGSTEPAKPTKDEESSE